MITMNDDYMRTIIDLSEEQLKALSSLCEKEQISRAEVIRQAVDKLIEEKQLNRIDHSFGIWKHRKGDARKYIDKIRAEWEKK